MGVLRLTISARPAHPLTGGREVSGGRIAVGLDDVRTQLAAVRDHLARHSSAPPDPATLPPARTERGNRERLERATARHRDFLLVSALLAEVGRAIERGEDIDCGEREPLERRCGALVFEGRLAWAECAACGRRYPPQECAGADWSTVADPLAGVGGRRLACPAGHTLYVRQTWVA